MNELEVSLAAEYSAKMTPVTFYRFARYNRGTLLGATSP
jgi:hypothetical protein